MHAAVLHTYQLLATLKTLRLTWYLTLGSAEILWRWGRCSRQNACWSCKAAQTSQGSCISLLRVLFIYNTTLNWCLPSSTTTIKLSISTWRWWESIKVWQQMKNFERNFGLFFWRVRQYLDLLKLIDQIWCQCATRETAGSNLHQSTF